MWYKDYGWKQNPFSVKHQTALLGLDNEKKLVLEYVNSGDICLVTGKPGVGKTSMLKWLKRKFGWKYKIVYFNAEDLDESFKLAKKIGKKIFRPRILLLDEAHNCDDMFTKELKNLWDHNRIKSVVIAQIGETLSFPDSLKSRIGNRVIRLTGLHYPIAKALIDLRTENKNPFSDKIIELMVDEAKHNPRKILEHCEQLCIGLQGQDLTLEAAKGVLTKRKAELLMDLAKLEEPTSLPDNLMPIDDKKLSQFSPMQKRMILLLFDGNRTAKQLAQILNSSEGSVGKQLSTLTEQSVVKVVNHRRPKVYGLHSDFKTELQ
ncbi:MAG: AAA family ATPase [Nanoarchaeota archaeon]|nr:AAA family ATPase [Nanoarchaeota archaeon]